MYQNKIIIICEGPTEVNAVKLFLEPKIKEYTISVGLKPLVTGHNRNKIRNYVQDAIEKNAKAVFSIFDIYNFPWPDDSKSDDIAVKLNKSKSFLVKEIGLSSDRFFPHFSVHETEAWFFSDNNVINNVLGDKGNHAHPSPEIINFQNPPSRRLNDLFIRHQKSRYNKKTDSDRIFRRLDFSKVNAACPYFKAFFDDLLKVALM